MHVLCVYIVCIYCVNVLLPFPTLSIAILPCPFSPLLPSTQPTGAIYCDMCMFCVHMCVHVWMFVHVVCAYIPCMCVSGSNFPFLSPLLISSLLTTYRCYLL